MKKNAIGGGCQIKSRKVFNFKKKGNSQKKIDLKMLDSKKALTKEGVKEGRREHVVKSFDSSLSKKSGGK